MEMERPVLLTNKGREPVAKGPMKSLVAGGMRYIRSGDGTEELFALDADPEERTDASRYPQARSVLEGFRRGLRSMLRSEPNVCLSSRRAPLRASILTSWDSRSGGMPTSSWA